MSEVQELKPVKRAVILDPQRMKLSEYDRQDWVVTAEQGTNKEDVLDPQYWSHMASQMRPYDHIEVRVDTGEWLLQLIVLGCDRNWARVHLLNEYDLVKSEAALPPSKYDVAWKGPHNKWCVIRKSDGEMIAKEKMSKEEAVSWLKEYDRVA